MVCVCVCMCVCVCVCGTDVWCVFQEQRWLSEVFEAVQQQLLPLIDASLGLSVSRLSLAVVSKLQTLVGSDTDLPVSYR